MEHIHKDSLSIKATEVLFFQDATIEKFKANSTAFASTGSLSILYFSDYHRFVLQINDWKYPLLRRLPIVASKDETGSSRTYVLPAANGFFFRLRIGSVTNLQPITNLETIFANNANFTFRGEDAPFRKLEVSPDDKVVRPTHAYKEAGVFDKMSETLKQVVDKVKISTETLKTGTKNITSTKKRIDQKTIKTSDFRKSAKSSLNKKFFESAEKETREFMELRKGNSNLSMQKDLSELIKSAKAPTVYIGKEDIEEEILNNKDLAVKGSFNMSSIKA